MTYRESRSFFRWRGSRSGTFITHRCFHDRFPLPLFKDASRKRFRFVCSFVCFFLFHFCGEPVRWPRRKALQREFIWQALDIGIVSLCLLRLTTTVRTRRAKYRGTFPALVFLAAALIAPMDTQGNNSGTVDAGRRSCPLFFTSRLVSGLSDSSGRNRITIPQILPVTCHPAAKSR